jgi:hypothetical protein
MEFTLVKSAADLFKDKKLTKVKQIYSSAGIIFKTGKPPILYSCVQNPGIYKIEVIEGTYKQYPLGEVYCILPERRVDLYDGGSLLAQWKGHKLVYSGFSPLLKSMGIDKNFVQLYNLL